VDYKIAPPESLSIIGSNSINTAGDVYILNINSITLKKNQRKKRFFDVSASILLLLLLPIVLIFNSNIIKLLKNIFLVLFGTKTWIGLNPNGSIDTKAYGIKEGVLYTTDYVGIKDYTFDLIDKANEAYCRNFKLGKEVQIFLKLFGSLGR
jgi:hypothetical protein